MCEWTGWSVPSRRDGGVCGLSDVLEPMSPSLRKYFLSTTALKGILRRADARGKALPTLLRDAIEWMLGWWEMQPKEEQGGGIDAIALDGDNLKPREDQRKGGNGFGINEDGAGYTLTGVDRHGVAYGMDARNTGLYGEGATGEEVSMTQDANQYKGGKCVVQIADGVTLDAKNGFPVADGVSQSLIGGTAPGHKNAVVSTNSNGEDVAPTISQSEYRMGQNQKDTCGGYVITRMAKEVAEGE